MILRVSLFVSAALLLAAHFLRQGDFLAVALCLAVPLLLLYRRHPVLIVLQVLAYGAALNWILVAARLAEVRQQSGQPWLLAACILGGVATFTFLAGFLLNSRGFSQHYRR